MTKVIFIVGLPGSGKTTLGKKLAAKNNAILLDDFCILKEEEIVCGERLIITDPTACLSNKNNILEIIESRFGPVDLEFIAFANDPDQCIRNIAGRDEQKIPGAYIKTIASRYKPESFTSDIRDVFRPK